MEFKIDAIPHTRGYEGDSLDIEQHRKGVFIWHDERIYIRQWKNKKKHGCSLVWKQYRINDKRK